MPLSPAFYAQCEWPKCKRTKLLIMDRNKAIRELNHHHWTVLPMGTYCPVHSSMKDYE